VSLIDFHHAHGVPMVFSQNLYDLRFHPTPRRIEEFKSQDLANSAWSFAALAVRGVRADAFMTAVAGAALKRLTGTGSTGSTAFTAQGISNII